MPHTTCEICRLLPDYSEADGDYFAGTSSGELPPAHKRLQVLTGRGLFDRLKLLHCPLCDTYYCYEYEKDYNLWSEALCRLSPAAAQELLGKLPGATAQEQAAAAAARQRLQARLAQDQK